jgi:hypothetical protein
MVITRSLAGALALAALLAACSTIRTVHDVAPDADFARYKSWTWITEESLIGPAAGQVPANYISPIDEQRIRRAVERELGAKGYRRTQGEAADLVVSFAVGSEEKTRVYSTPSGGGFYDGYGYGGWYGGSQVRTYQYTEGTLTLQFFDGRSKQAVWVGWASKQLSRSEDPEKVVNEAVQKMLQEFPNRS